MTYITLHRSIYILWVVDKEGTIRWNDILPRCHYVWLYTSIQCWSHSREWGTYAIPPTIIHFLYTQIINELRTITCWTNTNYIRRTGRRKDSIPTIASIQYWVKCVLKHITWHTKQFHISPSTHNLEWNLRTIPYFWWATKLEVISCLTRIITIRISQHSPYIFLSTY